MVSTSSRCAQCNVLRYQTCHASNQDTFLHSLHSYSCPPPNNTKHFDSWQGRVFSPFLPKRVFDFEPIYSPVRWTSMVKLPQETHHSPVVWRVTELPTLLLSTTNKMQRYTIFFITVHALHVSVGFSAHHQELKNCRHSIEYMPSLLAATASVGELELEFQLTYASGSSEQSWHILDAVCTVLSSWWWAEKPTKTCGALTVITNIV